MVKHSLDRLLDKYPYFLDKREISNLFKVTKVNNTIFQDLYNSLFQVYQSFHLNKRLLVWKTQEKPYAYQIHFCCSYHNLRKVEVYKNDTLIHRETFDEHIDQTNANEDIADLPLDTEEYDNYCWTYDCKYVKTNMLPIKVYRCTTCDTIYFGDTLPINCEECGHSTYITTRMYRCDTCDEIYFTNEVEDLVCNNHCNDNFTEVYAFRCLGNQNQGNYEDEMGYLIPLEDSDCGELYIGDEPPFVCKVCGATGYDETSEIFYDDDAIVIIDNSTNYDTGTEIEYTEDTVIDHIDYSIIADPNNNDASQIYETGDNIKHRLFPVIPNDTFKFYVETWDEYNQTKGFPEKDHLTIDGEGNVVIDEFDHDFSLDEIGALNNIPRKQYLLVESQHYPYTEPPFNNRETEDDYHYMKRMIEHNIRLWGSRNLLGYHTMPPREFRERFNPTTLELWKQYSVDGRLVNREKHLLKLFDVRKHNNDFYTSTNYEITSDLDMYWDATKNIFVHPHRENIFYNGGKYDASEDLVNCWHPREWEHKDKFCDDLNLLGVYFFVDTDNYRPLPYEDVLFTFRLMNSISDLLEDDFYVEIYDNESINNTNPTPFAVVYEDSYLLPYTRISRDNPTILYFRAYYVDNDEWIGDCVQTLYPRDCNNLDFYVNSQYTGEKENGSKEYPFKDMQTALDYISPSRNTIGLLDDITIPSKTDTETNEEYPLTYFVSQTTKILGCNDNKIPTIENDLNNRFFNIVGSKNSTLSLINLNLKSNAINSKINLGRWQNSNKSLEAYETVIVHGGIAILTVTTDKEKYFPTDIIKVTLEVKNGKGNPITNQRIKLNFDGEDIGTVTTDNHGIATYTIHTNKTQAQWYTLIGKIDSDLYFDSQEEIRIDCTREPHYINSESTRVLIEESGYTTGKTYDVYVDGVKKGTVTIGSDGKLKYTYNAESFGTHVIYFTDETGIISEYVIDIIVSIATLKSYLTSHNYKLIRNFNIISSDGSDDGDVTYDEVNIANLTKIGDLDGVIIGVGVSDPYIETRVFTVPSDRVNENKLSSSEAEELKNAVRQITYNDNSNGFEYNTIGTFWST